MSATGMGLLFGLVLGLVAAFCGFSEFLIVALLGGLGLLIGRIAEGKLDVGSLVGRLTNRR